MKLISMLAAALSASFSPNIFPGVTSYTRSRAKGKPNPAGSKLARKAARGQIAVKHHGTRLNHISGINYPQVTK